MNCVVELLGVLAKLCSERAHIGLESRPFRHQAIKVGTRRRRLGSHGGLHPSADCLQVQQKFFRAERLETPRSAPRRTPDPPRQPQPGELLMTFEHGRDLYRVELRDFDRTQTRRDSERRLLMIAAAVAYGKTTTTWIT